jgi:hypothetical protein
MRRLVPCWQIPGGGYELLAWDYEGTSTAKALQDHGVAPILVKYRLPSDKTMPDKSATVMGRCARNTSHRNDSPAFSEMLHVDMTFKLW